MQIREQQLRTAAASEVAVLFDFDGTLADTEVPAMEVAFWELAPYFPNVQPEDLTPQRMREFIRVNAGKAFDIMLASVERDREAVGLPPVEEVRAKFQESFEIIQVCNTARAGFGLRPIELCREEHKTLKEKQKAETLEALANLAKTNDGVVKSLNFLKVSGFKFAISTTSPKSRVIACLDTMRLADDFPQEKIHSGSSDFDPPRFKPAPDVYLKAAAAEEVGVEACIAVEDSLSGVGSAADAGVALIVGYVGGGHITAEALDGYAETLLAGGKSKNGRGADVVIRDMEDLPSVVNTFLDMRMDDPTTCDRDHFDFEKIRPALRDRCWTTAGKTGVVEVEDPNPR